MHESRDVAADLGIPVGDLEPVREAATPADDGTPPAADSPDATPPAADSFAGQVGELVDKLGAAAGDPQATGALLDQLDALVVAAADSGAVNDDDLEEAARPDDAEEERTESPDERKQELGAAAPPRVREAARPKPGSRPIERDLGLRDDALIPVAQLREADAMRAKWHDLERRLATEANVLEFAKSLRDLADLGGRAA